MKSAVTAVAAAAAAATADEAEAQGAASVSQADVEAATRVSGREYTPAQREQVARRAGRSRAALQAMREGHLSESLEPATHFDPRIPGVRVPTGRPALKLAAGSAPVVRAASDELAFLSVVQLSRLIRARKISSTSLTRMYLERLKRYGPPLRCVVTLTEELALQQAARADREIAAGEYRGPLHGIPWGAKDLLATRGTRTTWGARPYENQVFDYDATVVKRLEAAGAVLVAKLSMGELAQGDHWFGGITRCPWNLERGSSGSSAGPGSATAAGLVGFSIGSETHGSIVSPSVANGVTGLRPTYGRVPRTGAMALCWTLDKLGPMCRAVEDCAVVLHAIHGADGVDTSAPDLPFRWDGGQPLSRIKVGYDAEAFERLEAGTPRRKIYEDALAVLRRQHLGLRPVRLPQSNPAYQALIGTIITVESAASFQELTASGKLDLLERQAENSWPNTFRYGSTVPAVDYLQALRLRRRLQSEVLASMAEIDVLVTPPFAGSTLAFTNLTGNPTLITRCGLLGDEPVSIEFVGGLYREAEILRVALAFERATRWHTQWPDMSQVPAE